MYFIDLILGKTMRTHTHTDPDTHTHFDPPPTLTQRCDIPLQSKSHAINDSESRASSCFTDGERAREIERERGRVMVKMGEGRREGCVISVMPKKTFKRL